MVDTIILNVGGTKFETSKTLLKQTEYFNNLFTDCGSVEEEIYIDRNPNTFGRILRLLKDPLLGLFFHYEEEDFDYFGIQKNDLLFCDENTYVELNVSGEIFKIKVSVLINSELLTRKLFSDMWKSKDYGLSRVPGFNVINVLAKESISDEHLRTSLRQSRLPTLLDGKGNTSKMTGHKEDVVQGEISITGCLGITQLKDHVHTGWLVFANEKCLIPETPYHSSTIECVCVNTSNYMQKWCISVSDTHLIILNNELNKNPKIFKHVLRLLRDPNYFFPRKYEMQLDIYGISKQNVKFE